MVSDLGVKQRSAMYVSLPRSEVFLVGRIFYCQSEMGLMICFIYLSHVWFQKINIYSLKVNEIAILFYLEVHTIILTDTEAKK